MRTDSDRNLSAEADPNPARKTRERVLTIKEKTLKALVLSSGGIDSTTAVAMAVDKYGKDEVCSLSLSYGQKHDKEIDAAKAVAAFYNIEQIFMDLESAFKYSDCSLLKRSNKQIPKKSYAEQILQTKEQSPVSTYVPFRNGLFLSTAAAIALSKGCSKIYYGIHKDDAAGAAYPDCSAAFNNAMSTAIYEGSGSKLELVAPFVDMNKAQVVKIGLDLKAPYELTWSCYEGGEKPCGCCGTCIDRAKAFELNGAIDPALL